MLKKADKEKYIQRYSERLKSFGHDPKTLGWGGGRDRQKLRFSIACELALLCDVRVEAVLDVGCGFGDLGNYIAEHYLNWSYLGIDINGELVSEALTRYPNLDLVEGSLDELDFGSNQFDLVVANGIFGASLEAYDSEYDYIRDSLSEFYRISKVGVAADFMSTWVDWTAPASFHADPGKIYEIAKGLSDRVVIRSDYLKYEFMVYILKEEAIFV